MHFSKTYSQVLLSLPPELRENAIEYRQLKKLIHQIVNELSSLGFSHSVLHNLLDQGQIAGSYSNPLRAVDAAGHTTTRFESKSEHLVIYEFSSTADLLQPQLRLSAEHLKPVLDRDGLGLEAECIAQGLSSNASVDNPQPLSVSYDSPSIHTDQPNLLQLSRSQAPEIPGERFRKSSELVIPLVSDAAFYYILINALQSLSNYLALVRTKFISDLESLSRTISYTARPVSYTSSFRPHSILADAATIRPSSISSQLVSGNKSDLYSWREIFQLYIDSDIFNSSSEGGRGERMIEDSQNRLQLFMGRVAERGLQGKRKLKSSQSRQAFETFVNLNHFILDLKKFQHANAEATRKILKKHTKRTLLPLPSFLSDIAEGGVSGSFAMVQGPHLSNSAVVLKIPASLPRELIQALGEILLPIIPHIDDYSCLICTNIAFKPIRLGCGHLFCVRCLVKLQKRGKENCPMCRAPTVVIANRSNVDWALLNFMQDWFPKESKEKQKQNEREAAEEQLAELGVKVETCSIM